MILPVFHPDSSCGAYKFCRPGNLKDLGETEGEEAGQDAIHIMTFIELAIERRCRQGYPDRKSLNSNQGIGYRLLGPMGTYPHALTTVHAALGGYYRPTSPDPYRLCWAETHAGGTANAFGGIECN